MKNLTKIVFFSILLTVMGFSVDMKAQNAGIQFFHGTFAEAQAKAKAENKLIFMDAYTSWCAPCRYMAANVFTDQSVGEYYNAHFVNIKVDMEKGEGPELGRRYNVNAYPTFLFINGSTGEVALRSLGGKPASDFISEGQKAVKSR
jgi:thiol:disulfide interchange protein